MWKAATPSAAQQTRLLTAQDTTLPTITCPADIAVEPESPDGTVVSFAATATDLCDGAPSVVCPDSGTTFRVGMETEVTCTATDASNNQASCSLRVKVFSEQEVVSNLQGRADVLADSRTINSGQARGLASNLRNVLQRIDTSRGNAACGQLQGLASKLNGWVTGGTLSAAEAEPLLNSVASLQATLSCG